MPRKQCEPGATDESDFGLVRLLRGPASPVASIKQLHLLP